MTRIDICAARLVREEGVRLLPYNDATGKRVTCLPGGHITIGVGFNLENGLTNDEVQMILQSRLSKTDTLLKKFEWYADLDETRGSVFLDLAWNLGPSGLLKFTSTIHYASLKAWSACATSLLASKAAAQLPTRYKALAHILITGES